MVNKHHLLFIRGLDTFRIHNTSTWRSQVCRTASVCSVNIIREGEKGIARTTNSLQFGHVRLLFLARQLFGRLVKQTLPLSSLSSLGGKGGASHKEINGVGFVGSLGSLFEW